MDLHAETAARHALALAARYQRGGRIIDARVTNDIICELHVVMDRHEAICRRDAAIREAFELMGRSTPVRLMYDMLERFSANEWPLWRWSAAPPDHATPLTRAMFEACRWASASPRPGGEINLPGQRQLARLLTS
jgi:hypothetical protein